MLVLLAKVTTFYKYVKRLKRRRMGCESYKRCLVYLILWYLVLYVQEEIKI